MSLDPRIAEIASEVLRVPPGELGPGTAIGTIETWDSLGHLQLILRIEAGLGVRFSTELIPELSTLGRIQDEVERRSGRSGAGRT